MKIYCFNFFKPFFLPRLFKRGLEAGKGDIWQYPTGRFIRRRIVGAVEVVMFG